MSTSDWSEVLYYILCRRWGGRKKRGRSGSRIRPEAEKDAGRENDEVKKKVKEVWDEKE